MSVRSFAPGKEITSPRGMWSVLANKRKGTPERASFAQNVRIAPGIVSTRPGTTPVLASVGRVTGLWNWITPDNRNLVLYQDVVDIKAYEQGVGTNTIYTTGAFTRRPCFTDFDIWTYFTGYTIAGDGTFQVRIYDGTNTDIAFRGPVTLTAASGADDGPGQCTQGTHYFGFVYQNRTGYAGKPTITLAGTPLSVNLAAPLRKIHFSVTLPALADAGGEARLYLIMTRADNPNTWYFMPTDAATGAIGDVAVPYNTIAALDFYASLSDEDMADSLAGDTANDYFFLLSQRDDGTGPIQPSFVNVYGTRMCYGDLTKLYVSEQNDPQYITEDRHVVSNPNKKRYGYAFQLPNSPDLFLTGDRWTSKVTDNGDVPSTWAPPIKVSDTLGARYPSLVCTKTKGNYVWVACEAGVFLFDGQFSEKPLTYLVADQWARVNWDASWSIEMADDTTGLKLYVAAPIDTFSEPAVIFVFDYTNGREFDQVDITLDFLMPQERSSLGIVKEAGTGSTAVWIGPFSGKQVVHFDATTHSDEGQAFQSIWESGLVRSKSEWASRMIRVAALDLWIRGQGAPAIDIFGPDHAIHATPPLTSASGEPATLSDEPGNMYQLKFDLSKIENYTVQFRSFDANIWWEVSGFTGYTKADLYNK